MMNDHRLFIKNMVCARCITAVEEILKKNHLAYSEIQLGEVVLEEEIRKSERERLQSDLKAVGFELIDNRKQTIIEKIKRSVLEHIADSEMHSRKLSAYVGEKLNYDYSYLSDLFSSVEGITIEQYFILQRIEKVKELLVYDQLSISEIAYELGFSSGHHLSSQFKKVTGLTPTHFKEIGAQRRNTLDTI